MINTSRRNFLSGAGAVAATIVSGAASAQNIDEVLSAPRRGNWNNAFDARASQGGKVASNLPIFSPETVMHIEQAVGQYSGIVGQGGWPTVSSSSGTSCSSPPR